MQISMPYTLIHRHRCIHAPVRDRGRLALLPYAQWHDRMSGHTGCLAGEPLLLGP